MQIRALSRISESAYKMIDIDIASLSLFCISAYVIYSIGQYAAHHIASRQPVSKEHRVQPSKWEARYDPYIRSEGRREMGEAKMRVKQVYMYPIKSIRGTSPPSLVATYMGFPHDRRFMLLRVAGNQNMHVSQFPEMCLFTTALAPDSHDSLNPTPSTIRVTYTKDHTFDRPDQKVEDKVLEVPIAPDTADLEKVEVIMHSSPTQGYDMGRQYNDWFSERFGYEVKLLCLGENRRKVLGNVPPDVAARQRDVPAATSSTANGGNGWLGSLTSTVTLLLNAVTGAAEDKENKYDGVDEGISFADCAPYLVISTKSWENAQKRLPEGEVMDISKFRPNIIVEGADEAFEEDFWGELQIGTDDSCRVVLTQNCTRCNSLNIDYNTGKVGEGEAGKILKKLQSDRRVDPGAKWSPVFGRYGFLARLPAGQRGVEIKVGDEVKVLKRNQNRTRFEWPSLSTN